MNCCYVILDPFNYYQCIILFLLCSLSLMTWLGKNNNYLFVVRCGLIIKIYQLTSFLVCGSLPSESESALWVIHNNDTFSRRLNLSVVCQSVSLVKMKVDCLIGMKRMRHQWNLQSNAKITFVLTLIRTFDSQK